MRDFDAYFTDIFSTTPLMGIFRGLGPAETVQLCETAWEAGLTAVEIPIQTPDAMPSLRAAIAAGLQRGLPVGAGTVRTNEQLNAALEAGAAFTVAPGLDLDVASASMTAGIPHLPGVATSNEINTALKAGLTWLKAFPAAQLGAGWIKAQLAPFPQVNFVATGGMNPNNAAEFLNAGARVVALGKALEDGIQIRTLLAEVTT